MIGLPTRVASRMSSCETPALRATSAARAAERFAHRRGHQRGAARIHHRIGHAAHQILAEADLRIHDARGGDDLAARQIAQVRRDRGRADVDREAEGPLVQSRPDADDLLLGVHRHGDLPGSGAQRRLQHLQHGQIAGEILEAPLGFERLEQPAQIARRIVHVRLLHLHVVQAHHRIQLDRARVGLLAHHLAMHLAARGHVDDHVGLDARRARQAPCRPASGARREKRISGSLNGDRLALEEETPCLANSPSATSTWQRPHRPRPPHTESMSTPRLRAACSSGVPTGKWPRLPEGMNTTSGSRVVMRALEPQAGRRR